MTPSDEVIAEVARDMGVGDTFRRTPVGVFFGEPGRVVPDPYFGGAGPERTGCLECGDCMIGCRYGAQNALAERAIALWPNAGDADQRPPPGSPYLRLDPVPPRSPAVPGHAPAALRLRPTRIVRDDTRPGGTNVAEPPS
jgi:hypothetical protein